jgi:hypothetical protein
LKVYTTKIFLKVLRTIGNMLFGAVCYMPDDWTDGYSRYDLKDRTWEFECSLKNYEGEIQYFLKNVLSEITEELEVCECLYEEDRHYRGPTKYTLKDIKNLK